MRMCMAWKERSDRQRAGRRRECEERSERRPGKERQEWIGGWRRALDRNLDALYMYSTSEYALSVSDLGLRSDIWAGWSGQDAAGVLYNIRGPFHFLYYIFFFDS